MAVTPFAAWAVARVAGLERGSFATQLMTATPFAAAGSLVPVLLAAFSRNRVATAVALVTATALGLSVLPRAVGTANAAPGGRPLKVLTINLLFGKADPAAVLDLVRRLDPDVLSAQELTPGAVQDFDAAGLDRLMPYRHLEAVWSAGGAGIFAKYPMTPVRDLFQAIGHNMPAAEVALPGGAPIQVVNVHPFPPLGTQVQEWTAALDALPPAAKAPVRVLAGDFNASLDHAALRRLLARGYADAADRAGQGLIPTWPANRGVPPIITIDHVLVDERAGVRAVSVHTVPGTDHRAVFAELYLPAG
ncbi:endonuclease/exonuclease/phosphatase family protein [Spongiactinospora sp. TRM90649]|uniref:endonuclease/exonuclease/phosphatase family protein n=1 Tax=Spongiactinospora sp. TRM90649 TaxID=3031114 RepID=UPI0023F6C303|nr:endonuclease/exonuclease/phosphatase family protein [Spongiactinospora sp. TRM90649]MDF5755540.1 endonuclease/exonuclease/phosphatase family protein [Spongiactinospora sp. TRM90649]